MEKVFFDDSKYEIKTCKLNGNSVTYRAFENIDYCRNPVDPIQKLNIYVPEAFYEGKTLNGYSLKTAPIFAPNSVGGYMEGPALTPGTDPHNGQPNAVFEGLRHGYVVACAGVRGRTAGQGRAPALIVDMKAAVRFLRHNAGSVPGNVERIITSGTSAGGALSALAGATGNSVDYEPYLNAIGAADARDDIYGANCYCPIHNLENADAAYEWMFHKEEVYNNICFIETEHGIEEVPDRDTLDSEQKKLSENLKDMFPGYINALALKDRDGNSLILDENGEGSFKEYIRKLLIQSAQTETETHWSAKKEALMVPGAEVEKASFLVTEYGKVTGLDLDGFVKAITRMKPVPAFDGLNLEKAENEEFGDEEIFARHFTRFSYEKSKVNGALCSGDVIKMLNATRYIGEADTARYWRIRHGTHDRDTSLAIPAILALLLENNGCSVDIHLPWGVPHSGDYDLKELFEWIDQICVE